MRRRFGLVIALLCFALIGAALPAAAGSGLATQTPSGGSGLAAQSPAEANPPKLTRATDELRPTEILVKYRTPGKAAEVRSRVGAKLVERLPGPALEVLKPTQPLDQAIEELEADPNVVYAEPNYVYKATSVVPNDPHYNMLWALNKIRMPEAWTHVQGSRDVTIAVVDSGVALGHPDLAPNIWRNPGESGGGKDSNGVDDDGNGHVDDWRGWDWIEDDNRPGDSHGHGSHVAGTIGASGNDGYGLVGVNWTTSIMPLRTLDSTGVGTSGDIAAAFTYAGRLGVDIVNASLGGSGQSTSILQAINSFPETLFVVAAGNDGTNNDLQPQYPCNYPAANLICVAASDTADNLASFSNYGPTSVDLAAPGVSIVSTAPAKSQPFTDSFETDLSNRWVTGGTNGLWTRGVDTQGGYLSDSLGIDYLNNTDSWIATSNPISLKDQTECKLHFTARIELESGTDTLLVEMSRDQETWAKVGGWTGSSSGRWNALSDSITSFDGSAAAYLRFRLKTNSSVTAQGTDIDDVRIRCLSDAYLGNEFLSASGTSMAAPHVAGVAGLLKAAVPGATIGEIVHAILSSAQTTTGLLGRVATSGRLDAAAALEKLTGSALGEPTPLPSVEPTPPPTEPTPEPTASATPSPDPTPTATPQPDPTSTPVPPTIGAASHARTITLKLGGALVLSGRINLEEQGYAGCMTGVPVKIKRNGRTIKKVTTTDAGFYRARIRDRRGRYVAVATAYEAPDAIPTQTCLKARSRVKRRS